MMSGMVVFQLTADFKLCKPECFSFANLFMLPVNEISTDPKVLSS